MWPLQHDEKDWQWLKPWRMGTHLRVLSKLSTHTHTQIHLHMYVCTVEPVKLNTCVHWTPAYIEHFFMSRHTLIENQWEATWIHWTPVYLEHWTPNLFPQATINLSTLNILRRFETFHWKWGQMRYIILTVLLSNIFQMMNVWSF